MKNKKKEAHAQAKAHANAHAQAQAKAHTQAKRHMQLHEVDSISLSKKWNSEKQKCEFQKNKCSMLPVVNSQSRVFQNDSKYSKSGLQGTSDSKKLILTSQKRNLSHVQSTCSSKTPRTLTTIFEVGGRGEAYKYIYIYIYIYPPPCRLAPVECLWGRILESLSTGIT